MKNLLFILALVATLPLTAFAEGGSKNNGTLRVTNRGANGERLAVIVDRAPSNNWTPQNFFDNGGKIADANGDVVEFSNLREGQHTVYVAFITNGNNPQSGPRAQRRINITRNNDLRLVVTGTSNAAPIITVQNNNNNNSNN